MHLKELLVAVIVADVHDGCEEVYYGLRYMG